MITCYKDHVDCCILFRGNWADTNLSEFKKKNYKNVNVYKDGIRIAREEMKVLKEEMIDSFILNRRNAESPIERDGVIDMLFKFECEEDLDYFTVTTDSSNNRGYSSASLKITEEGTALFSGNISTEVPKDGNVKYTGYANIMSGRKLVNLQFFKIILFKHFFIFPISYLFTKF